MTETNIQKSPISFPNDPVLDAVFHVDYEALEKKIKETLERQDAEFISEVLSGDCVFCGQPILKHARIHDSFHCDKAPDENHLANH